MEFDKPIPELSVAELNRLYTESEECDKRMFAEMRTNLQIVAGEHYAREGSRFWSRIRDDKQLTAEQRLKLTKNHSQRVTKIYRNQIESVAPDVAIVAANENELQDQKSAELNYSYWQYIKANENFPAKRALWCKNFVEIGEVCVKVFWNPDAGQIIGYKAEMMPDPNGSGQQVPVLDEMGQPKASDEAVYSGKLQFDTFEAYNLRRDPSARSMEESPYLLLSKLLPKKALRQFVKNDDEMKLFDDTPSEEYTVFDNNSGIYKAAKDQILVKEIYWRPGPKVPKGWFMIYTSKQIIAQGELPYGIFPIVWEGFDEQSGSCRAHSIIRHIRPAQIEINRCASKMAEHQITVGDDKVWVPANTKVSQGALLPGIRVSTYTGVKPEITEGRAGDQYLPYLQAQIAELYQLAHIPEAIEDQPQSQDLYANLFQSYKFKKKFAIYGEKFERFICKLVETSLAICKVSASEQELVPAFGKSEYINISEFKNSQPLSYQVKIQPRTDDIESQFGQQLVINHTLQYVGPNMDKEDIGQMLRLSPFLNQKQMYRKFTQKYDSIVNDVLALDRGQWRPPKKFDDHDYVLNALSARMSDGDYERLNPNIQAMYERKYQMHAELKAQQLAEIQAAQAGFIPSGGYLVTCDFYVPNPTRDNPQGTKRVRVPSESLDWLLKKLQTQGSGLEQLEKMPGGVLQDVGGLLQQMREATPQLPTAGGIA